MNVVGVGKKSAQIITIIVGNCTMLEVPATWLQVTLKTNYVSSSLLIISSCKIQLVARTFAFYCGVTRVVDTLTNFLTLPVTLGLIVRHLEK